MPQTKDFLKQFEMFIGLSDEMLTKISTLSKSVAYQTYEIIIERNSPPDNFYLIQDGSVEILATLAVGEESGNTSDSVVVTLGTGQSFGEMGLVDSGTRSASVRAAVPTQALAIDCQEFLELCETDTDLGYQIMRNIAVDLSFKLRSRNMI